MVLLPAILLLLVFRIVPLFWGLVLSFTNFDGLGGADWVGAANYRSVLADPVFQDSLVNTLLVLATLPIWIMLPMLLAVLIHQGVPGGRLFRAVYFLPAVLSSVIVGSIFNVVLRFDGSLNASLKAVGLSPVDWLGNGSTALGSLITVHLWSTFGMSVLIFMATTLPEFLIWLEQGKLNRPGYAAAISGVLFALMAGVAWMQVRIMSRNAEL
jgi:multiple sugar transport system permease protein